MKTVLVLSVLLCAAFAAPADQQAPEAAVEYLNEKMAAAPVMEENMATRDEEVKVPEDSVPVSSEALLEEAEAPKSRFNPCPDGWFSHNSRCFLFVNSLMSWYDAEEHCNGLGAALASVRNPREYKFLQQITQMNGQSLAWLGGFNLQGVWMWIDREGFYYTNWYSSPPSSSSSSSYPCIYLRTSSGWGNTRCSSTYRFICSKDPFSC